MATKLGLAEARERAGDAKRLLRDGVNPIEEKAKKRAEAFGTFADL